MIRDSNMKADNGIRANAGVVCSLQETDKGKLRLVFDDVSNSNMTTRGSWKHEAVFTWNEYSAKEIEELELSEKELADIGTNLLVRLIAQKSCPYKVNE